MKKSQFIKKVITEKPEFSNIDTYFYVTPLEHILSGFLCEITPRGAYVWRFLYPLFDKFDCIHLTYSKRLDYPAGYIDFNKIKKKQFAGEFLARIDSYINDAYNYLTLEQFYTHIINSHQLLDHKFVLKTLGCIMVLMNNSLEAKEYFSAAVNSKSPKSNNQQDNDSNQIINLLESGNLDKAKQVILGWENEMKIMVGL